jgi:hypothetical protein
MPHLAGGEAKKLGDGVAQYDGRRHVIHLDRHARPPSRFSSKQTKPECGIWESGTVSHAIDSLGISRVMWESDSNDEPAGPATFQGKQAGRMPMFPLKCVSLGVVSKYFLLILLPEQYYDSRFESGSQCLPGSLPSQFFQLIAHQTPVAFQFSWNHPGQSPPSTRYQFGRSSFQETAAR